ncbi:LCP family protein [Kitasatospora sp. NPDC088346]|uniref:LCP family protein n=1 Tax=Kitasatospora sp. NPDC088346 TaxID=3364073 RepID=UPI00380B4C4D
MALSTTAFVAVSCGAGYLYLRHLDANIQHAPLGAGNPPPPAGQADAEGRVAMNILIIGTDSRKGLGGGYGDRENTGAGNNDVNIVLHVYPDKRAAVALDLPRDTLIDLPKCTDPGGRSYPAKTHRPLNEALGRGGPGCVQDTVQSITKLKIDHYVLVNFQGVKDITDAVGGVDVNLCQPIRDRDSELDLPAGQNRLSGEQGLQFVRTRHAVQDGSSLGRFAMQRAFLSALLRKVTDQGTLLDPTKAFPMIDAATKSIMVDDPIAGTTKLVGLAHGLRNIKPAEVSFVQPPMAFTPDEQDRDLRQKAKFVQPGADRLFGMILADRTLNGTEDHTGGADQAAVPSPATPAAPAAPAAPAVDPATVTVTVLNGTPQSGLAVGTSDRLTALGYHSSPGTGAGKNVRTSGVRYPRADQKAGALAVAAALGLPAEAVTAGGTGRAVVVTLGTDYRPDAGGSTPAAPAAAPAAVPSDVSVHQGDESTCVQGWTGTH